MDRLDVYVENLADAVRQFEIEQPSHAWVRKKLIAWNVPQPRGYSACIQRGV